MILGLQDARHQPFLVRLLPPSPRDVTVVAISIESAIGAEDVAMGIEVQEIAEGLDRYDCPGSSLLFWREAKEKYLQ